MKASKLLLLLMLVMCSLQSKAVDYPYLAFMNTDGSVKTLSVESLTLTVENGQLVATSTAGTQRFTLTELSKMYFAQNATAINEVTSDDKVNGLKLFYDMNGRALSGRPVSKGVYVVKENGKTRKIVVK